MAEYLFLVPKETDEGRVWQQASVDGLPLKTTDPQAYPGMPKIRATSHVEYKSWEEHVEETVRNFRQEDADRINSKVEKRLDES